MRQAILEELRRELLTRTPLESVPEGVWKRTGALNTWGTNAIEGNTLTRKEVERILLENRTVGNRPVSDVTETIQHAGAFATLIRRRAEPIRLPTGRGTVAPRERANRGNEAHAPAHGARRSDDGRMGGRIPEAGHPR